MEPYRTLYPQAGGALSHTEQISERVLALPTGTTIGHREIELVATVIRSAYDCAAAVKAALN